MTAPVDYLQEQEDEAWRKEDAWYGKLATDPAFYDQQMKDPVIEAAEKYHPTPELVKSSVAAQGWLSHRLREDLQGPAYTAARDAYSNQYFGKAQTTDQQFWKDIQDDYKLRDERTAALQELHQKVIKKSFEDALKGEPTNIASIYSPWHEKNMEIMDKDGDYLSSGMHVAQQARDDIERFRMPAAKVYQIMAKTHGNPTDQDITEMGSVLAGIPYEDRQDVYRYVQTASSIADPKTPLEPLSVIADQLEKAIGRSGAQIYGAVFQPFIQGTMPLDEVERAARKIRDNLIAKGGSPEEIAVQQGRIDQVAVARELKDLGANGIDPIKPVMPDTGWLSWGKAEKAGYMLAGSAPYLALSVLGGPGLIIGGAAIADYEYERIRLQNKDIDPDAAHAIADVSGAAQTFLMKLRTDALLARTPGVARLMGAFLPKVGTHGVTRFLGQTAAGFIQGVGATEAQMAVSSFLPAVVAAFREDMPDADFGKIFGDLVNQTPEVFFMNAPLALIGGGVSTWRDWKNPQTTINPKTLGYRGFSEAQKAKILNSPEAVLDAVIREETPKRTQANIKAGIKELEADIATAKANNAAPETPTVEYVPKADGTDFWHVKDPDGKIILSTENIDTATAAVTDWHQQKMLGEENQTQRAKAEGTFQITPDLSRELREEGMHPDNIRDLLAGKKTVEEAVSFEIQRQRPITAPETIFEPSGEMAHKNAMELMRRDAIDRITQILKAHGALETTKAAPPAEAATTAGQKESFKDIGKMGGAAVANMYEMLFKKLQAGDLTEAGVPSRILAEANIPFKEGRIKSPEDLQRWVNTESSYAAPPIRAQVQPEPDQVQAFIEQQQMAGFRQLDDLLEKIHQLPPEQREVAVAKARDLMADIELRHSKLQQLSIAKKEADIGKLQRAIEKATIAGRADMVAKLRERMEEAVTRQTPGEAAKAIQQEIVSNLGKLEAIVGILPREARGLVGGYETLAGMRTPKERLDFLEKRIAKVGKIFEKYLRTFYGEKIERILKPSAKEKEQVPKGIGVKPQRELDAIRETVKLTSEQASRQMDALAAEASRTGRDAPEPGRLAEILEEWDRLEKWSDLENRSAAELAQNYNELKTMTDKARQATKVHEEARRADVKTKVGEISTGIEKPTRAKILEWQRMNEKKEFGDFLRTFNLSHKSFIQILERVLPKVSFLRNWTDRIRRADVGHIDHILKVQRDMEAALIPILADKNIFEQTSMLKGLREVHPDAVHTVEGRETETRTIPIEQARNILDDIIDKGDLTDGDLDAIREALALLPEDSRKKNITFEKVVSEGERVATPLTKEEMISAILSWGDSNLRAKMERTGWSQESIDEMMAVVSGDELAIAMLEFGREFYRGDYDIWNAVYKRMFYRDMLKHPNYAPGRFQNFDGTEEGIGLSPFGGPIEASGFLPGPLKTRVEHSAEFRPTNFTQTLWEHVYQRAHWTNFAEINRELRGVIGNRDIQQRLFGKLGPSGLKLINNWLNVIANAGNQRAIEVAAINKFIDKMIGARVVSALALSIKVILNQTDSAFRFMLAMTGPESARTMGDPFLGENYPKVWASESIQRRIMGGANPAVRYFFQRSQTTPSILLELSKQGLMPMQAYDAWLTAKSANMVYTFELRKALEGGANQELAHQMALDRMDEAVYRYSQPMGVANKSLAEVSGNRFAKMWMMFQSDARLKTALLTEAWSQGNYRQIAVILALHALSTAVVNGYRTIATDEAPEDIWSFGGIAAQMLFGPIAGYFLVEPAIKGISSWMSHTPLHESSPLPMSQWASHVQYATTHIEDLFGNDDDPDAWMREVNHLVQATAIWGPASGVPAMFVNAVKPFVGAAKEKKEPRKRD